MAEFKTDAQVNYGWGLSLNMTGKAPAIAKRIFTTYEDALAFVNDANDAAIIGLHLSVMNDSEGGKKGIYFVEAIGTTVGANDGKIVRQATSDELTNNSSDLSDTITNNIIGTPEGETINENYDTIYEISKEIELLEGNENTEGSIAYDIKAKVDSLDAEVKGEGNFVDVTVKQVDGKITEVVVEESDIAKATDLEALTTRVSTAEGEITKLTSDGEGSVAKAIEDAKTKLLGDAAEEYNTLGKLEDKIQANATAIANESTARENAINDLDATVTSTNGQLVNFTVVEENGKLTSATIDETKLNNKVSEIEQSIETTKSDLLGEVSETDAKTLAALNDKIENVETKINDLDVEDVEVVGSYVTKVDQTDGKIVSTKKSLVSSANTNDMLVADTTNGGLSLSNVWDCGEFEATDVTEEAQE